MKKEFSLFTFDLFNAIYLTTPLSFFFCIEEEEKNRRGFIMEGNIVEDDDHDGGRKAGYPDLQVCVYMLK